MATVWEQVISPSERSTLYAKLQEMWDWADVTGLSNSTTHFWIDEAKTKAIRFDYDGSAPATLRISVQYNNYYYHDNNAQSRPYKIEKTDTALILSYSNSGDSVSSTSCEKIIICNGFNPNTNTNESETIMIYLGSKSSSNVSTVYASDVVTPVDMAEQNSNANTNAKTTNLIPFYNTASAFITTDVYKSLCEDIGAWYFGDVTINGRPYRMSGSVFARDI